ncbi:MAG TPA: zinc ribbon domain-containing protein [Armatimonadota bacterium]
MRWKLLLPVTVLLFGSGPCFSDPDEAGPPASVNATATVETTVQGDVPSTAVPVLGDVPMLGRLFTTARQSVLPDTKVDLDLNNATVKDAVAQLAEKAGMKYEVEGDLPKGARISLKATNAPLQALMDAVSSWAGLSWSVRGQGKNRVLVASRSPRGVRAGYTPNGLSTPQMNFQFAPLTEPTQNKGRYGALTVPGGSPSVAYSMNWNEERSVFTCPLCKGQVTVVDKKVQPKCPDCGRVFQESWKFCPYDGAKRPKAAAEWKYCPFCGKQTEMKKSADTSLFHFGYGNPTEWNAKVTPNVGTSLGLQLNQPLELNTYTVPITTETGVPINQEQPNLGS